MREKRIDERQEAKDGVEEAAKETGLYFCSYYTFQYLDNIRKSHCRVNY